MQQAIVIATNEQVEIAAVRGGWTTVRNKKGTEWKVRNSALGPVAAPVKVAKVKAAAVRKPRVRKPIEQRRNGVIDSLYLPSYVEYKTVRPDGRKVRSMDKGDELAVTWRSMTLREVYVSAAEIMGVSAKDLQSRFEHLNPGMQRMALGNMVRRVMKEKWVNADE